MSAITIRVAVSRSSGWLLSVLQDRVVRGSSLLTLGQLCWAASGYVVNVVLARSLGVEGYGTYGLVISILVWLEMILAPGIGMALEKSVASHPQKAGALWRQAIRVQGGIAAALFGITFILAPAISNLLKDPQLTFFLRFAAADLLFFGFFRLGRGRDTALQRFSRVALLLGIYALVKAVAIPVLALTELGLSGAIAGNTLASIVGVAVVFKFARSLGGVSSTDRGEYLNKNLLAVIPLSLFITTSQILVSLDLWAVKFIGASDAIIGLYVAATMLPKALVMVSGGRMGMMNAVVGRSLADGDYSSTKQALLKVSMFFGGMTAAGVIVVYAFADFLITLIFSQSYAAGTPYLKILIVSYGAFAMAEMLSSALIALDRPWFLCTVWAIAGFLAIPLYVAAGEHWGPIGIAYSIGVLSVIVASCLAWMIKAELAKLRIRPRKSGDFYKDQRVVAEKQLASIETSK
jgi:O-antigen/teichoic acid export membrane protein